ncbi:MAG: glycosyltransferase [Lachnospiraceae bacterium]|nr:glycosyltransferase [Lachnospiraceae bacterium]
MNALVDVIIMTYKPDNELVKIVEMLEHQSVKPNRIIIMNTEMKYLEKLTYGNRFLDRYSNTEVHHQSRVEFNHGKSRNKGARRSQGDYMVFMTQDALPKDSYLLEKLLEPFENEDTDIAVSYARQLPKENCSLGEIYNRSFNYPPHSMLKTKDDLEEMGIKTFFCSDVCACYKKSVFEELGGFVKNTIFNEDMIYAYNAIMNGYGVYYAAEACVYHSHDYTAGEYFKRNFDLGVSQADHPEIFEQYKSEGEGKKLVKGCVSFLISSGKPLEIFPYLWKCAARYSGYRKGKNYKKLSRKKIMKYTTSPYYWRRHWDTHPDIDVNRGYGKNHEGL